MSRTQALKITRIWILVLSLSSCVTLGQLTLYASVFSSVKEGAEGETNRTVKELDTLIFAKCLE